MVVSGNLEKVCPEKSQNHFMTLKPVVKALDFWRLLTCLLK